MNQQIDEPTNQRTDEWTTKTEIKRNEDETKEKKQNERNKNDRSI